MWKYQAILRMYHFVYYFVKSCMSANETFLHDHNYVNSDTKVSDEEPKINMSKTSIEGLRVNILTHSKITKTYFSATTSVGMRDAPHEFPGLAHFFAEQIMRTTPRGENKNLLNFLLTPTDSDMRYCVTNGSTQCSFISDTHNFEKILRLFAEHLCDFNFPENELEHRKALFNCKLMRTQNLINTQMLLGILLPSLAKDGSDLQHRFIGSQETLKNMSHKDLCAYRNKLFTRENTTITVITPLNSYEVCEIIKCYFEYLPSKSSSSENMDTSENPFQFPNTVTLKGDLREEFHNRIVLFNSHLYVLDVLSPKILFIVIPLPEAHSSEQLGLYSLLESIFMEKSLKYKSMKSQHDSILHILKKFKYAYDFSMGIESSKRSPALLWLKISMGPDGFHTSPEKIMYLFQALFIQLKRAVMRNLRGFKNSCCKLAYQNAAKSLGRFSTSRDSSYTPSILHDIFSSTAHYFENTDVEKSVHNIGCLINGNPMQNDITDSFVCEVFDNLCWSNSWVVMHYSTSPTLKPCNHLGQKVFLDAREKRPLDEWDVSRIEKAVLLYFHCFFNTETHEIELLPKTVGSPQIKFSHAETCKQIITFLESLPNARHQRNMDSLLASYDNKKYLLKVTKDSLCLRASINNSVTLEFIRIPNSTETPEIKFIMHFDEIQEESAKIATMFAVFIAYTRFENQYLSRISANFLEMSLRMDLNTAEIRIRAAEADITSICTILVYKFHSVRECGSSNIYN
ncbi:hypothetical protein ENBRE01_1816 [Enteropsectra breve]|nr:hypothetical protein ENBRE01_1816 [Enteropsectra breve]